MDTGARRLLLTHMVQRFNGFRRILLNIGGRFWKIDKSGEENRNRRGFFSPPRRRRFFLNTAAAAACLPVRSRRIRTRLAFPLPEFVHERSGGAQPQPRRSCHKLCHAPRLPFNSRARIRHSSRDRRGYCWYLLPLLLPSAAVVDEESKYTTHSHGTCTCIVSSAGRTSYYTATLLIHYWLLLLLRLV
jgi:hypothetical protein